MVNQYCYVRTGKSYGRDGSPAPHLLITVVRYARKLTCRGSYGLATYSADRDIYITLDTFGGKRYGSVDEAQVHLNLYARRHGLVHADTEY